MKLNMVRTCALVAVALAAAGTARAQQAVSRNPVPPPKGVARTPESPPPAPQPPPRPDPQVIVVPIIVNGYPYVPSGNYVSTPGGYIQQAPPGVPLETPGMQPYPAMVWIAGRYEWNGAQYVWRPGEWVYLPAGYTAWVPGKWEHNQFGWFWVSGYWR